MEGGLRALYRSLELPGTHPLRDAHAALDAAVMEAYGFAGAAQPRTRSTAGGKSRGGSAKSRAGSAKGGAGDTKILAQLLALNLEVASALGRGEEVTPPGVPASFGDPAGLITDDCIRAT